ncbi:MAG: hypothetical protein JW801_04680 [Bacteroidales bacterium]|nr:hypothetical protein [Bacteroidales bacterium]
MNIKKYLALFLFLYAGYALSLAQNSDIQGDDKGTVGASSQSSADTTTSSEEGLKKSGWSWGAVPAIAYDSDIGFKYGGVLELWDYGDGSLYPDYENYFYFEWSNTTKGSQIWEFDYDSRVLIPHVRTLVEASYLTERALDFYGFNGYETNYNSLFEDDSEDNDLYISRLYYRQERKLMRLRTDFQGRFLTDKAKWLGGVTFYNIKLDTVDIDRLNEGKDPADMLPAVGGGIYGQYTDWGLIPGSQINGGTSTLFKAGLMFDTRDNEANPMKGIWTEVLLFAAPGFLGSESTGYGKYSITHRQYFTLVPNRLSFVYRLAYQGKLWGDIPTYMMPLILNGGTAKDRDGLGGSKTVRGMLRNRVVGEDYFYGNLEMRWKFLQTVLFNQNIYLALNTFLDFGMITRKYDIENLETLVPGPEYRALFSDAATKPERPHFCFGAGFHIAINENFIIAINNGYAIDENDGDSGLYIGLKWLF